MWALIDNYDSFTYILRHYLQELHDDVRVWKNDELDAGALVNLSPEKIILSPGPCRPASAGNMMSIIRQFYEQTPILGICLGHQALGEFFGARLVEGAYPMHGKVSPVFHADSGIFKGLPNPLSVMRYHSLVLDSWEDIEIVPLAFTEQKELMAFQHRKYPCTGIQFHPESVMTEQGREMLANWAKAM